MKVAIITSVIGMPQSTVKDPIRKTHLDVDYFAFVDKQYDCKIWKQIQSPLFSSVDSEYSNRRNAKLPKILGFCLLPGYDYYIWHDNYQEVFMHPTEIVETYMQEGLFAGFKHPVRNCIYDEMDACVACGQENPNLIEQYKVFLEKENFPRNAGLIELSAFMYKNTPEIQAMLFSWWEIICKYSSRDQISFPYVLHKHNITPKIIPGALREWEGNNEVIPHVRGKYE